MIAAIARSEPAWCAPERPDADGRPRRDAHRFGPTRSPLATVDAVEHEVRSLLNLVGLIAHCLRECEATDDERAAWRRDAALANARLARLRAAGWCPSLLR